MPKPMRRRATLRQGPSIRPFGVAYAGRPLRSTAGPMVPHRATRRGVRIDPAHANRSTRYSLKTLHRL